MKRRRRSAKALLLSLMLLASLLAPMQANAASDYDDVIVSVDSVALSRNAATQGSPTCGTHDLTYSWEWVMTSSASYDSLTQYTGGVDFTDLTAAWGEALDNEVGWAVAQVQTFSQQSPGVGGDPLGDYVRVVFTPTPNAVAVFDDTAIYYGSQKQLYLSNTDNTDVYVVQIAFDDPAGGMPDECVPRVKTVIKEPSSTPSFWENESVATTSTSGGYVVKPLFVNASVAYPNGYAGEVAPNSLPGAQYVAMGDSFSSGEGNPDFESRTDRDGYNQCHRSPLAYPYLLQSELSLGSTAFVACSGATTNDILGVPESDNPAGIWDEPAQVSALSGSTELVTLSIGGNDVGFADFAYDCLFPVGGVCDEFTDIYEETIWKINNVLPGRLAATYSTILAEAENATIYVLAYPRIAPYKGINDPFDQDCGGLYDEFPNTWGDARAAYEVTNLLNQRIQEAVAAQNSSRLVFVPVASGAFAGHDACSSDSYFHGIVWPEVEYSVHPDVDGHVAYKEDLIAVMN